MKGRILFSAPASGAGKTTITCGVLQSMVNHGSQVTAYKSGPDYIDPMFHSQIIGAQSRNLDLFLMGEEGVKASLQGSEFAVIEGAMGYYDGIAMTDTASAYELAKCTQTPVVLVVDGRGGALSVAATVAGFANFRLDSQIKGVIFNRIHAQLYHTLKYAVLEETGIQSYGYLPQMKKFELESRHLGLVTAAEVGTLKAKMHDLAEQVTLSVDLSGLFKLAMTAPKLPEIHQNLEPICHGLRLAVAQDKAFCFYYADALSTLERLGATLVPFSPMTDTALPGDVSGLYLGGGYPELYAKTLSENACMRQAVASAIQGGMPTIAECGGFLYLHKTLEDGDGSSHPMCGVVDGHGYRTEKLSQFGYVDMTAQDDGLLCAKGEVIPAHEFHYWHSQNQGADFAARKPMRAYGWDAVHHTKTMYAGFPHCHMGGRPEVASRFLQACQGYQEGRI